MAQLKAGTTIGGKLAETVEGAQAKADAAQSAAQAYAAGVASAAEAAAKSYADNAVAAHANRTDNPHQVTPQQIGAETPNGAQQKADAAAASALSSALAYTDSAVAAHANATSVHGATSSATANRIVIRDSAGRAQFADPIAAQDAATKAYADEAVAAHAGRTDNPHQVTAAQLGLGDVLTHLAQILYSRIVDHNLDVANPPNGWYVRWENGLQVAYRAMTRPQSGTGWHIIIGRIDWGLPAAFSGRYVPYATAHNVDPNLDGDSSVYNNDKCIARPDMNRNVVAINYVATVFADYDVHIEAFAIGRWK